MSKTEKDVHLVSLPNDVDEDLVYVQHDVVVVSIDPWHGEQMSDVRNEREHRGVMGATEAAMAVGKAMNGEQIEGRWSLAFDDPEDAQSWVNRLGRLLR